MIRRHLTYANVMSTVAVFGVLAGGSAYAVSKIGSQDIKPRAVKGKHINKGAVRGHHVREGTFDARGFSAMNGSQQQECNPISEAYRECAATVLNLRRPGRVLIIATGANYSHGVASRGNCEVRVNGAPALLGQIPGETELNTSSEATNGFARTLVTGRLPTGLVRFALACNQPNPLEDFRVQAPTIAAIALTHGRR